MIMINDLAKSGWKQTRVIYLALSLDDEYFLLIFTNLVLLLIPLKIFLEQRYWNLYP